MRRFSPKTLFMAKVVPVVMAGLAVPFFAFAQLDDPQTTVLKLIGYILLNWVQSIAWLLEQLTNVLVIMAQYNQFYKNPIVTEGWNIVINVTNMMFIVALLVIAAGTVLSIQNYRYNRLLGNVVLMALLVNFSKLIAGFFIQLSQVVMLTFVNSFKDALFGNFATMFGLDKVFQFSTQTDLGSTIDKSHSTVVSAAGATGVVNSTGQLVASLIVAMAFLVLAGAVIAAFIGIIAYRIVALWVLLILSPLAYGLAILPQTKSYADRWWKDFTEQLTRGPVIAFFLWLALAVVAAHSPGASLLSDDPNTAKAISDLTAANAAATSPFASDFLGFNNIIGFIVAIVFLLTGLKYATEAGGTAGNWAKKLSGGALAAGGVVTGLNAIRDRTVKPVQGYLKARDARNNAAVQRRAENLTLRANQVETATIGQVRRGVAGATGVVSGTANQIVRTGTRATKAVLKGDLAGAGREIAAGTMNIPNAAADGMISGARMGTTEDKILKAENDKIRASQTKFEGEIGRYAQMGEDMLRSTAMSGSDEERFHSANQLAENNQLNFEKNPNDIIIAQELGRRLMVRSGSGEEMTKAMANIKDSKVRDEMFTGARSGIIPISQGKTDILAAAGGIGQAFGDDLTAAADYMTRNASKVADQVKNKLISADTLRNESLVGTMTKLKTVNDETILEMAKDPHLAEAYKEGMVKVVESENVGGDYTTKNEDGDKVRRSLALAAKGGKVKVKDPTGTDVDVNAIDFAYNSGGAAGSDEEKAARRFVAQENKNLTKYELDPDVPITGKIDEIFAESSTVGGLSQMFEKNAKTVEAVVKHVRANRGKNDKLGKMAENIEKHDILSTLIT